MKKYLLLSLLFGLTTAAFGQMQTQKDIALRYLEQMSEEWNLEESDYADVLISRAYKSNDEISHVYLNQTYAGITIHNAVSGINIKNGEVFYAWNQFVSNIDSKVNTTSPAISAQEAIGFAAKHLEISSYFPPNLIRETSQNSFEFEAANFTRKEIPVELKYAYLSDGSVVLAWDMMLQMKANSDYWNVRINATNGEFIEKDNWTLYCNAGGLHNHDNNCGIHQLNVHNDSFEGIEEATNLAGESYRVFALPAESPIHGPHVLVTEPNNDSSPTGWHDINGDGEADYTTLRGNNVNAFVDANNDFIPDGPGPDGGSTLTFDFPYDSNSEPDGNMDAAMVNIFYMCNMMHDLMYIAGFDEQAGNFQVNNYGNGGNGNDPVIARGFVPGNMGANLNNAFYRHEGDGTSASMNLGLWDAGAGGLLTITEPSEIAQTISSYGTPNFGTAIGMTPIIGNAVIAKDATSDPTQCCEEIANVSSVNGQIALIDRGLCDFSAKVLNAQNAGAVAVLICNVPGVNGGTGEEIINMGAGVGADDVTIPSLFLPTSTCNLIRSSITADVIVKITLQDQGNMGPSTLDAALDNGVFAHEFGHGISLRIMGGGCIRCWDDDGDGTCDRGEPMGEGWSDFFTLVSTAEPGDSGADRRGIGNYVSGENVNGGGIRRFPYSTDMSINPQTYDDIKTGSVPHGVGEPWAQMLWDMYWAFVDLYGWKAWDDPDLQDSGNFKAVQLVIEALKNTTCNPGYVDGRDAIIGTDLALFNGDHECLIWDVFARRGVGYYADQGSPEQNNDGTENFESRPQCIAELKIKKTATELITPGDDIEVAVNVINHRVETINGVYVTDEIPDGLTFSSASSNVTATVAGNTVTFELGDMEYEDEIDFTYTMSSDPNIKSTTISIESFEDGPNGWQVNPLEGTNLWQLSLDAANSGQVSWYIDEALTESDQVLVSTPFTVSGDIPVVRFWHRYDTQPTNDAGFIQVSEDGGFTWTLMNDEFIRNGYPGDVVYGTFAIPGLQGFSGSTNGEFIDSYVDVSAYAGQEIQIRFRFGTDEDGEISPAPGAGWYVDDFELMDLKKYSADACVYGGDGTLHNCTGVVETVVDSDGIGTGIIEGELDQFNYNIFPNPANNQLNISIASKSYEDALISLITFDGKEVLRSSQAIGKESRVVQLNIESIPTGLYVVKIETASGIITDKVMIK